MLIDVRSDGGVVVTDEISTFLLFGLRHFPIGLSPYDSLGS